MRVTLNWLRDFTPAPDDVAVVVATLNDLGLAVESVEHVGAGWPGVVVARVLSIGAIEGADRIRVVQVDAGQASPVQVVCGAWNFVEGDLVPLATVGSVLPGDFAIAKRKMKGVVSDGMLCAPDELGLPGGHGGILVLDGRAVPGASLADALGITPDVVLDLEVNANRPDAMSVAGVARDLAARLGLPFAIPEPVVDAAVSESGAEGASVTIESPDLCGRFVARVVPGITVGPSPAWLADRLTYAGMRPINNVVDASNYVMLELGVPNHAYDLTLLPGRGLRVRWASEGESITTLDDVERPLGTADGLICDAEGTPVGIAGIMGGAGSGIGPATTEVLLEAAWWQPTAIAHTSKRLKLRTEASARFERGADWDALQRAADRFCELLGVPVAPELIDERGDLPTSPVVPVRTARVNALLGTELDDDDVRANLEPLGFRVAPGGPGVQDVAVPTWRPDTTMETDVIEEVARLYGYARIARTVPSMARTGHLNGMQIDRRQVRQVLAGAGASEGWTPTFLGADGIERAGLDASVAVRVANPLDAEAPLLRTSLLPGLLGALAYNASHRNAGVALFEVGHTFALQGGTLPDGEDHLPDEREAVAVAMAGSDAADAVTVWHQLVEGLGIAEAALETAAPAGLHPTRSAELLVGGKRVGVVGEVDPAVLESFAIAERVAWLELDLGGLLALPHGPGQYRAPSRFPSSDVDLAFEVDEAVPAVAVERTLFDADELVTSVDLFDSYRGAALADGRRSLAYTVRLQAPDRTLTDDELATTRQSLIAAVEAAHPASLRT